MKLRSEVLKGMLAKAIKGAGGNKLIPVTSLLKIEVRNGVVTLETTDATNYLYVMGKVDSDGELYAVVDADLFAKLVSKTTSEFIDIFVNDTAPLLHVKGNGSYTIEMPLDGDGMLVQYPDPVDGVAWEELTTINKHTVDDVLFSVKPSLATTYENPCYTGYYAGDTVIATDNYKIARMDYNLFNGVDVLISSDAMDLLGIFTSEKIRVSRDVDTEDRFLFESEDVMLYSPELIDKEDFALEEIEQLLDVDFPNMCEVSKSQFISVLDRLALFISPYDRNAVKMTFSADGLQISSVAESGVEVIGYTDDAEERPQFLCEVDVEILLAEVKAVRSDVFTVQYGLDNALKFVDGDLTIVVALLE